MAAAFGFLRHTFEDAPRFGPALALPVVRHASFPSFASVLEQFQEKWEPVSVRNCEKQKDRAT
jgi:hypothetical protein